MKILTKHTERDHHGLRKLILLNVDSNLHTAVYRERAYVGIEPEGQLRSTGGRSYVSGSSFTRKALPSIQEAVALMELFETDFNVGHAQWEKLPLVRSGN